MGELFNNLCKGPVVVIDDEVNRASTKIGKLVEIIEKQNLPVLKYENLEKARDELNGLIFSNFVILDWKFESPSTDELFEGAIRGGDTIEEFQVQENINFIKELQKVCLAPIFVISYLAKESIEDKLEQNGILKDKNNFVFVERKTELLATPGKLIQQIEEWIKKNPHVYLAKWWTNEWLRKNTSAFWDLYHSAPNWPSIVYKTLKDDGEEPLLGLIEMLSQLIYSEISTSSINESYIVKEFEIDDLQSLKKLYNRLVYTTNDIEKDVKPGDIFKIKGKYYLNIRPECDTTKRNWDQKLYLIRGEKLSLKNAQKNVKYDVKYGIILKEYQIVLVFLDGKDVVEFNKKYLKVMEYSEIKDKKICRVVHPYITKIRQSFISYIGRFGTPAYPKELLNEIFSSKSEDSDN